MAWRMVHFKTQLQSALRSLCVSMSPCLEVQLRSAKTQTLSPPEPLQIGESFPAIGIVGIQAQSLRANAFSAGQSRRLRSSNNSPRFPWRLKLSGLRRNDRFE
jgi:hypothetical protein